MDLIAENNYEAIIEAVLFTMGEAVEVDKLAIAIDQDVMATKIIMAALIEKYENENRGMKIIEIDNAYQMCTRPEYYENLIKVAKAPRKYNLTDVLLETLSIVAYKQPVTKLEIEKIRGVSSDHAVNRLVEYGLVSECGRLDAPGRPMLFGTTMDFLRVFGIQSIDELPVVKPELIEDFKLQAEMEISQDENKDEDVEVLV